MAKLITVLNTAKYLKPVQISSRIIARFKSNSKPKCEIAPSTRDCYLMIPELDLDDNYISRFLPEYCKKGKVRLLNDIYNLEYDEDVKRSMLPLIWFNLQYFEYAIAWGAMFRKNSDTAYIRAFEDSFDKYLKADVPYNSYVISLQIPNLLIAMELFGNALSEDFILKINSEIYRQYIYLKGHLETHLLGNHYFENIKTLIIGSYYLNDDKSLFKYYELLRHEVDKQILPDGMHFELSPMYHKIILEDLLRLAKLNVSSQEKWLLCTINKMTDAMLFLEKGFPRTPLFNDSGDNVAKSSIQLFRAVKCLQSIAIHDIQFLKNAGYYRVDNNRCSVIIDAGIIGPTYMPGHGHCDCLSYEVVLDGKMFIVNSGTYQYQGELRSYFRSTKAHNTLIMDGHEQSQCWGEHRVAKRINNVTATVLDNCFSGRYSNYFGDIHNRRIILDENSIKVFDTIQGAREVKSYLHFSPEYTVNENYEILLGGCIVAQIIPLNCVLSFSEEDIWYASEFGKKELCVGVVFKWLVDNYEHGYEIQLK